MSGRPPRLVGGPAVLWLTPDAVSEPRAGSPLRTARLVAALAKSARVHLVVVQNVAIDGLQALTGAERVTGLPRRTPVAARLTAWRRRLPTDMGRVWQPEVAAFVDQAIVEGAVVVLDHLVMSGYRRAGGRYVLDLHDVESQRLAELPLPSTPLRRWEGRRDLKLVRGLEQAAATDPNTAIAVVSEDDAHSMGAAAVVVPNGADVPAGPPPIPPQGDVLFVGSLDYAPNRLGLEWFASEVWPLVEGHMDPLRVVGRGGGPALGDLARSPALAVIGEVPDPAPHLRGARVVAIPLRHGGGSRLKLLEAMAWGRPVVTTSKGAEGIPVRHGESAWIADSPQAFAEGLRVLLEDRERAHAIAAAGRAIAEDHSWSIVAARFTNLVLSWGLAR